MAASSWNPKNPYIVSTTGGIPKIIYSTIEGAASQSYKAGTPVYLDAIGTDSGVLICADGTASFTGIAMKDATGTDATEAPIQIMGPDDYLYCQVTNDGTAQDATDLTVGEHYGWYVDSDSVFYADENDETNEVLIFVEAVKDVNGDSTAWGKFKIVQGITGNIDTPST
jgi:hypothetical protein